MKNQYSFRLLAIGTVLIATLTSPAQQTAAGLGGIDKEERGSQGGAPKVEQQLKLLTEKLDLTSDQEARIKPIIQELNDATRKFMQDETIPREKRLESVRPWRERADKQIREILNDDQKNKLDRLEREPHPELHGT